MGAGVTWNLPVLAAQLAPDLPHFAQGLPSPFLWRGTTSNKTMWETVLPCSAGFGESALRAADIEYCDLTSPCHGRECPWLDLGLNTFDFFPVSSFIKA